ARAGNTSGSVAGDWVMSSGLGGISPMFELDNNNVIPSSYVSRPLNNLGGPNFDASLPAVIATDPSALDYPVGSGDVAVDPSVTVTDTDSFFFNAATVTISGNYNPATDSLAFAGSSSITATFNPTTGALKLSGDASKDDW